MVGAGFPTAAEWAHLKQKGRARHVAEEALDAATWTFVWCILEAFVAGESVSSMPPNAWPFTASTTLVVTVICAVTAFRRWSRAEGIVTLRESARSAGETAPPPSSTSNS